METWLNSVFLIKAEVEDPLARPGQKCELLRLVAFKLPCSPELGCEELLTK